MHALMVEGNGLAAQDFAERPWRHGAATVERTSTAEAALLASERWQPDVASIDIGLNGPLDGLMVGEILAQQGSLSFTSAERSTAPPYGTETTRSISCVNSSRPVNWCGPCRKRARLM
jgi:CheY-like chemotaxis protein